MLAVCCMSLFMVGLDNTIVTVGLPDIGRDLHAGVSVLQWTVAAYTIALAARNSVVLRVLDVLMDLLRESRSRALQVPGRPKRSFEGHRRILRAIQRRDAKAAEAAVRQHLGEIEEVVMRQI